MKKILMILFLCLPLLAKAESGFYIAGGLGTFYPTQNCNEVCFKDTLLAYAQAGYSYKIQSFDKLYFDSSITHASGPTVKDRGCELLMVAFKKYF